MGVGIGVGIDVGVDVGVAVGDRVGVNTRVGANVGTGERVGDEMVTRAITMATMRPATRTIPVVSVERGGISLTCGRSERAAGQGQSPPQNGDSGKRNTDRQD